MHLSLSHIRSISSWIAVIVLAIMPILVAIDYGGVLRWTHYIIAVATLVGVVFALPSVSEPGHPRVLLRHRLLIPLVLWAVFAAFQIVSLPASVVSRLSPGSAIAYTQWVAPYFEATGHSNSFPISIAAFDSWHAFAMLLVVLGVTWSAAQVFTSRARISWLLCVISIGAAVHVLLGIYKVVFPESLAWSAMSEAGGHHFGAFVNRNNAALMFNFGLAASLGLVSWRLTAMTGMEVDDPSFELNDLYCLFNDRESAIGVSSAVICLTGLLVCGSRGGLVAALAGGLLAFGWVRQRRGIVSLPVILAIVLCGVALLVVPFNLGLESIQRLELSLENDTSTILRDGRLLHWRDGLEAGMAYLPAGSGLSTYAYAYLPFQETGHHAWYHHADNLWLELFVEQGIVGLVLMALMITIIVRSLNRLAHSHDPIDQGLRTAGWYALGAILVSQLFDFGLIIPSNLLVAATLMTSIVARDASTRVDGTRLPRNAFSRLLRYRATEYMGCLILISALLVSLAILRRDAEIESVVRRIQVNLPSIRFDLAKLQQAKDDLEDIAAELDSTPAIQSLISEVNYQMARATEVLESRVATLDEAEDLYRGTGPTARRLRWRSNSEEGDRKIRSANMTENESFRLYRASIQAAGQTLTALPLDSVARSKYVYLDFIHRDPGLTKIALVQLQQIYRNNASMLMRLAVFSADSGEMETAVSMWRSALEKDPSFTAAAIEQGKQREGVAYMEIIPRKAVNLRAAAEHMLAKQIENDSFLSIALAGIDCQSCDRLGDLAECERLAGDIQYELERFDESFATYRSAIQRAPADVALRVRVIRRLREQRRNKDALSLARRSRDLFPQEPRFESLIKSFADSDLKVLDSREVFSSRLPAADSYRGAAGDL